jgi:cephalosporin-C deacetylase
MTQSAPDFDAFWDDLDPTPGPLGLSLERDPFYSQVEWTVYRMAYTGAGGYPLFAWLSVPAVAPESNAPVPAVVRMPDYASVHDIIYTPLRHGAVVMNATHRGQRHSDSSLRARYPGLLTENIDDPRAYLMRLVFADALRAVDALAGLAAAGLMDTPVGPLAVMGSGLGGSLALAAAARRPAVSAVAADTPLALGNPGALKGDPAYPLAEIDDYLRLNPGHRDAVQESAAPLDPVRIAPRVSQPVLLSLGRRDRGQCPLAVGEELARWLPKCDLRIYDGAGEGGGHEHGVVRLTWLRDQLGLA